MAHKMGILLLLSSSIKSSAYSDGSYKRTRNRVVLSAVFDLSRAETRLVRKGRRGCSVYSRQLTQLRERCCETAQHVGSLSWSIFPIPFDYSCGNWPKVMVEFHNWPEMGMCNFKKPVARPRYWWDVREIEEWINPDDPRAVEDDTKGKGDFDSGA